MWWNDEVKDAVEKKEDTWKEALRAGDEIAKERCMEVYKEKVKRCIYEGKKEVNEQFRRKMNQYYTPGISPHKPLLFTPIMEHSP